MPRVPTYEEIERAPKALLHDHLDGGLRPATIVELAGDAGHELPADDADALRDWFVRSADAGTLERYLETFDHTLAVMQSAEALRRVAAECAEDLAADGVVYAEVRFAPEQHLVGGLDLDQVVEAVVDGFAEGERAAHTAGHRIRVGAIVTAMRHAARSLEIAELAVRWRDDGVVGYDIAGAERGYPPSRHLDAFDHVREANFNVTIHAGEGFGLPSIWEAVQICGAHRLGHGVRIVDDISRGGDSGGGGVDTAGDGEERLGRLASYIRDKRVPLEMCPTSNVQTGAATSIETHPIGLLRRLYFRVTVNTDNRLMSDTSMTKEMKALVDAFGYGWDDLRWLTVNALKSAFIPFDERLALIDDVVKPGYAKLAAG